MYVPLAGLVDAAMDPRALSVLIVGLLASFAIAAGPPVRDFFRRLPLQARSARSEFVATAKDPQRARAAVESLARLPRPAIAYGLIGLVLAVWTVYAMTQPATETRTVERTQLEHVTSIGYVARGAPSVALPDGVASPVSAASVAQTGEPPPLFSAVLSNMDFGFQYELRSEEPLQVLGFAGSALRIKAQDGWERTLVLQPAQPLVGPQVTMWFTLDLDAVRLVVAGVEFATGSQSGWYDLTVVPVVRLAGYQGGAPIDETYSREFNLRYDSVRITPDADLEQTARKIASTRVQVPRRAAAFGLSMEWAFARWVGGMSAIVALAGAVLLVLTRQRTVVSAAITEVPLERAPSTAVLSEATVSSDKTAPPVQEPVRASRSAAGVAPVDSEAFSLLAASVTLDANGARARNGSDAAPHSANERAPSHAPPAA